MGAIGSHCSMSNLCWGIWSLLRFLGLGLQGAKGLYNLPLKWSVPFGALSSNLVESGVVSPEVLGELEGMVDVSVAVSSVAVGGVACQLIEGDLGSVVRFVFV